MNRFFAALLLLGACASAPSTGPELPSSRISLRLLKLNGSELFLSEQRGRVVLLTVISTWADPALLEVPRIKAMRAAYKDTDLSIICVVLEDAKIAGIFEKTFQIPYTVAVPDDVVFFSSAEGPLGGVAILPTSFLLDREGRIAARMDGIWPEGVLEEALDRLVASDRDGP
jgi:hypothetical protein